MTFITKQITVSRSECGILNKLSFQFFCSEGELETEIILRLQSEFGLKTEFKEEKFCLVNVKNYQAFLNLHVPCFCFWIYTFT